MGPFSLHNNYAGRCKGGVRLLHVTLLCADADRNLDVSERALVCMGTTAVFTASPLPVVARSCSTQTTPDEQFGLSKIAQLKYSQPTWKFFFPVFFCVARVTAHTVHGRTVVTRD